MIKVEFSDDESMDRVKEVFARPEINYEARFTLRGGDDD